MELIQSFHRNGAVLKVIISEVLTIRLASKMGVVTRADPDLDFWGPLLLFHELSVLPLIFAIRDIAVWRLMALPVTWIRFKSCLPGIWKTCQKNRRFF